MFPENGGSNYFTGDATGAADIATDLHAAILRNIDPNTGISLVKFPDGKFLCNYTPSTSQIDAIIAAGCSRIVLKGEGKESTRFYHDVNTRCLSFNLEHLASAAAFPSNVSIQTFNTANQIHRLTITDVEATFAKDDLCVIHALEHPEWATSSNGERGKWMGEGFRVKDVDAASDYLWVDGRLEFGNDGFYAGSNPRVYKLSKALAVDIVDIGFYPTSDTEDDTTARNTNSHAITFSMMVDCHITRCHFDDPWWVCVRFESCADSDISYSTGRRGLNYPDASDRITYFAQFYASCFNCWAFNCQTIAFRHTATTDGNGSSEVTANASSFTSVNGSATVTVNDTSHGLVAGDWVRFSTSTTANNVTISGAYLVATVPTSSTFTITAGTTADTSGSFGTSVKYSQYKVSNINQYGQPSLCGARDCYSEASRGAPWDTHVEGANIWFINCHSANPHSADNVPPGFIGGHGQVRCRRVTYLNCQFTGGNTGSSVKVSEHGTNNWVKFISCNFSESTYISDNGRGIYVTNENSGFTNATRVILENCSFDLYGYALETDVAVEFSGHSNTFRRLHRGMFDLATGSILRLSNSRMDFRSANLPGAVTTNRTLTVALMNGTSQCHLTGVTMVLGTDPDAVASSSRLITGVTQAAPAVVTTAASHGYSTGQYVLMTGAPGMTQLNGNRYRITVATSTTYSLNVDSTAFTAYTTAPTVSAVTQANPAAVTTSGAHGFTTGDVVMFGSVGGMTQLNNNTYTITSTGANTFTLDGTDSTGFSAYTSGGRVGPGYSTRYTAKHPGEIFTSGDNASGKTVSLTGLSVIDPSNIGPRNIMEVGRETDFVFDAIDSSVPIPKANLPRAGKPGRQALVTDETGGATLAFDNGVTWKRVQDLATVA